MFFIATVYILEEAIVSSRRVYGVLHRLYIIYKSDKNIALDTFLLSNTTNYYVCAVWTTRKNT